MRILKHYMNGEWVRATNSKKHSIINPATQDVIADAPAATREETIHAIKQAKRSYESGVWSDVTPQQRSTVLSQIADKLEAHIDEMTNLEVLNNGKRDEKLKVMSSSRSTHFVTTQVYYKYRKIMYTNNQAIYKH